MRDNSTAIHFINLSDYFQRQDKSITKINFLRYSEAEWNKIARNQFAYCGRLRASNYLALFEESGFYVCRYENPVDDEAQVSIKDGFIVNERFRGYSIDDLCVTQIRVAAKIGRKNGGL